MGLCDLQDVKERHRIPSGDTRWDGLITEWIAAASDAVELHCGRQFSRDASSSMRVFVGAGRTINIDDLSAPPTAVTLRDVHGNTLDVTGETVTRPRNPRPGEAIRGLTLRRTHLHDDIDVEVTGVWGHPAVPPVVREATVETVRDWLRATQAVSEHVPDPDEYEGAIARGIPPKARQLLEELVRDPVVF